MKNQTMRQERAVKTGRNSHRHSIQSVHSATIFRVSGASGLQAELRLTVAERLAAGKRLRDAVPRAAHAVFKTFARRTDPVAIVQAQARTRLPQLVPIRHARMLVSPFAFLRGSAAVMAADLASAPVTGFNVQACGDMHVANFGVFATPERNLVFGINDFDETLPGPWEWDLKRLAASAVVAVRFLGGNKEEGEAAARAVVKSYRERMRDYSGMGYLALWYARIDERAVLDALSSKARVRANEFMAKAKYHTNLQVMEKLTDLVDDKSRIVETPPLVVRVARTIVSGRPMAEALRLFMANYKKCLLPDRRELVERYQLIDVARKVVGVGSVGTRCWVIYLRGVDENDPLFLQVKEAQPSVLAPYTGAKKIDPHQGRRVVYGQRLIQGAPDIFLGWGEQDGLYFYVRQLRDMKGTLEFVPGKTKLSNFTEYCGLCGWALALAHAKSGDAARIAGYCGNSDALDEAIATYAQDCADQNELDYAALAKAAKSGKIAVQEE